MAQTTGAMNFMDAEVYVSGDGATWTNIANVGAQINVSPAVMKSGEQNTMDGLWPIVKFGKNESVNVTVNYVYTEVEAEAFEVLYAIHETAKKPIYLQFSPQGGLWFSSGTDPAGMIQFGFPGGDIEAADVIMSQFVVKCARLIKSDESV